MHWPIEDVVTNVRHILTLVKRATGNIEDPKEKDKDIAGTSLSPRRQFQSLIFVEVNPITRVVLASRQGPGITIADH